MCVVLWLPTPSVHFGCKVLFKSPSAGRGGGGVSALLAADYKLDGKGLDLIVCNANGEVTSGGATPQ